MAGFRSSCNGQKYRSSGCVLLEYRYANTILNNTETDIRWQINGGSFDYVHGNLQCSRSILFGVG